MKIRNLLLSVFALAAALVGCNKMTPVITEPYGDALLSENNVSISLEGGSLTVQFSCESTWEIITSHNMVSGKDADGKTVKVPETDAEGNVIEYVDLDALWLDANPKSGSGTSTITITASPNTGDLRNGSVHFRCADKDVYLRVNQGGAPAGEAVPSTCAEVIAGTDGVSYLVTGTCTRIANTSYGNWYLADDTGSIYIYGTVNATGQYPKDASGGWEAFGIEVGDKVTVMGPRKDYNGTIELVDVEVVSVEKSLIQTDQTAFSLPSEGGTFDLSFSSKATGTTIATDVDWLHILDIVAGEGGAMVVSLSCDPNTTTASRTGNINIKAPDAVKVVSVTQEGLPPTGESISDIVAKEDNSQVEALETTIVSAKTQRGFIATDGSKAIYVYNSDAAGAVNIGDAITFKGTKVTYNGVPEISPLSEYSVVSSGNPVSYPRATDITADVLTYSAPEAEYIQFTGTLTKSGNYYNIAFTGVDPDTKQGSIVYPDATLEADGFDGKAITVKGYFNGLSSAGKFINIIATSIEEAGDTPAVDYDTVTDIVGFADGTAISSEADVMAVTARGFVASDGRNAVYVYTQGSDFNGIAQVGDRVKFEGTKTTYAGVPEITPVTSLTVLSSGNAVSYPPVADITSTIDSYAATKAEYISITGKLSISGNYYNLIVDGATRQGSVVYPVEALGAAAWDGKDVTITGYFNGITGSGKYVNVITITMTEPGSDPGTGPVTGGQTVTEIISAPDNTEVECEALVSAISTSGFIATDGTNAVYVYTNRTDFNGVANVGDRVSFKGTKVTYNGVPEISPVTDVTILSSGNAVSYPTAKDINSTFLDYSAAKAEYITFSGTLTVSGNYYNVAIPGVDTGTRQGSISYPVESLGASGMDGRSVKVTGYFNGMSGGGKYLNVIAVKVEEQSASGGDNPTGTYEVGNTISAMLTLASGTEVTSDYCVVGAVTTRGYVAVDNGSSVLVYYGSSGAPALKVGDLVKFTGKFSPYNGLAQIANPSTELVAEGYAVPSQTSTDITSSLDNFTSSTSSPVTVTATAFKSGDYTNFSVAGATKVVSLYYPDSAVYSTFQIGDKVKITGYWGGLSSDGSRANVILTGLEVVSQ